MAEKEIVEVEVRTKESGTEETEQKFVKLQTRIKETRIELQKAAEAGDQVRFNKLKQDLDDLNTELEATNLRSKEFTEILSQIPGPLGNIAAQTGGAIDKLKAFGKLTFTDLKTAFAEFGKDLKGAFTTLGNLTGITKVYTTLNNALAASFVKVGVGEAAAAAGARAFAAALTATGIGALVVAVGLLADKVIDLGTAFFNAGEKAGKSFEKTNKLLLTLSSLRKEILDKDIARLRAQGATEEQLFERKKQFYDQEIQSLNNQQELIRKARSQELLGTRFLTVRKEKEKEINDKYDEQERERVNKLAAITTERAQFISDKIVKDREAREAAQEKLDEKEQQRLDKLLQLRLQALATLADAQTEAFKQTLSEQEREEYAVNQKYAALIALATQYNVDTTLFEEARLAELASIKKKFGDKEIEDTKDKNEKLKKELEDIYKSEFDQFKTALEIRLAFGLISEQQYQEALAKLRMDYAENDEDLRAAELDGIKFFTDKTKEYAEQQKDANAAIAQSYIDLGDNISTVFSRTATLFEQGSAASKAFGVLSVVANAASGIASAVIKNQEAQAAYNKTIAEGVAGAGSAAILLTNPVTAALGAARAVASKAAIASATAGKAASSAAAKIQIGTIAATSALQIAAILGQKKSVSSTGAEGGGAGGGGTLTLGLGPTVAAPQVGAGAFNQQGQIAGIVAGTLAANQSVGRPIRAYVVGNDITTEQQLDRRIRTAARLGG